MYVNRRKKIRVRDGRAVWYFELLRGYRDQSRMGEPRNKFVGYLGSIPDAPTPADRFRFWRSVDERLARMGGLSAQDEQKVRTKLQDWMPRPASLAEVVASLRSEVNRRVRLHKLTR